MYKKYWRENGKRYMLKVKEERVYTSRISGMNLYKTVHKLKILEKYIWLIGWKNIYQNQWDADNHIDVESKIHKCIEDCFIGKETK